MRVASIACFAALIAATTASAQSLDAEPAASVDIADAKGQRVGRVYLRDTAEGLQLQGATIRQTAGTYGFHLHMTGRCDAPGFESAGEHWNPTGKAHGTGAADGPHLGDLSNLTIGADGRGRIMQVIAGATLAQLMDRDGAALIIHTAPDDNVTQPGGGSGARMACGVVERLTAGE